MKLKITWLETILSRWGVVADGPDVNASTGEVANSMQGQEPKKIAPNWPYGDVTMKKLSAIIILGFGSCLNASADTWKWVDAHGKTHFVDSNTSIYTWVDENSRAYYSDKPEHESAVSVELVWHSTGKLSDSGSTNSQTGTSRGKAIDPNETVDERIEREMAEAYYCKQARAIYDSYVNAPQLYRTNADGQREYLSDEEVAATLAETETRVAELCV